MFGSSVSLVGRTGLSVREFGELNWSYRVKFLILV